MRHFLSCFLKLALWTRISAYIGCTSVLLWGCAEQLVGSGDAHAERVLMLKAFLQKKQKWRKGQSAQVHRACHEHVYMGHSQLLQSHPTQAVMLMHLNYEV